MSDGADRSDDDVPWRYSEELEREYGLPDWSRPVKERVIDRLVATDERNAADRPYAWGLAVDAGVAGPERSGTPSERRYHDLLYLMIEGDPSVDIDPASVDYDLDDLGDATREPLFDGLEPGELGVDHPRIEGFVERVDVPDDRARGLIETALTDLQDPRDAMVRLWAADRDLDLDALREYGRGVPTDTTIDDADRDGPRRFGVTDASAARGGGIVDRVAAEVSPDVSAYLFRDDAAPDGPADAVGVVTDGDAATLLLDHVESGPSVDAVTDALDRVGAERGGRPAVETVVLRGSAPYDAPGVRDREGYDPRDAFSRLVGTAIDPSGTDVVLEDLQAGRESAAGIAAVLDADPDNRLFVMRGRFRDDDRLDATLDAVDAEGERSVAGATRRLWKRDAVSVLDDEAAIRFAGGFLTPHRPARPSDPDGRRALGVEVDGGRNLLLPGDVAPGDVAVDSATPWHVVDCRNAGDPAVASTGVGVVRDGRGEGGEPPLRDARTVLTAGPPWSDPEAVEISPGSDPDVTVRPAPGVDIELALGGDEVTTRWLDRDREGGQGVAGP